jgi:hypothetical protein
VTALCRCTTTSCGGCCTPTPSCDNGTSNSSCGSGGAACQVCPAGRVCSGGVCV